MKIQLEVPGKTFLTGEYSVLQGGPALVAATRPNFQFTALSTSSQQPFPFHSDSPAGRWYRQSEVLLRDWKLEMVDPHEGKGGFGASGAQFVFLHALCTWIQSKRKSDDVSDVWQDFRACDKSGGSGADVVAQTLGAIAFFRPEPFEAGSYDWPFDETDFFVLRTGQKVETHSHLQTLGAHDWSKLRAANERAIEGFFAANIEAFTAGLSEVQKELTALGLQSPVTLEILEKLNACPGVLVTKGCGAMGADTVLAVVDRDFHSDFFAEARAAGFHQVASSACLAPMTELKVD